MNVITKAYLFNGKNDSLVKDRFNRMSSSISFNDGRLQAPDDYYIYGDFTLTTWFKKDNFEYLARLLKLTRSSDPSRIVFSLTTNTGSYPYYNYNNINQNANSPITYGKWQHLAFVIKGSLLSIYVDGILKYQGPTTPIPIENHTHVFIGHQNSNFPNSDFDDISKRAKEEEYLLMVFQRYFFVARIKFLLYLPCVLLVFQILILL
jgi:hypothetical protein